MINGGLRLARQARGYSQQQLAGMAGVSRQAVSAVEAGQSDPSLRVALAIAGALGMTVEELFGSEGTARAVPARVITARADRFADEPLVSEAPGGEAPAPGGEAPAPGSRVTLAPIGNSFAALPLVGPTVSRAGFLPAGGLVTAVTSPGKAEVRPISPPRPTLIVAGCDPALPLLEAPLSLLDPPIGFTWWPCTSREALRLASEGLVHAAGVHRRARPGAHHGGLAGEPLGPGAQVIGFSAWREGLVVRPRTARRVSGLADVAAAGLRLVNREPGAQARRVLDRELARIGVAGEGVAGYRTMATGHLQVADAIAAGLADAGVASEPVALAYELEFLPLADERFELVIPGSQVSSREVQALTKVLSSRWLADQLASLPGYDPAPCGQLVEAVSVSGRPSRASSTERSASRRGTGG